MNYIILFIVVLFLVNLYQNYRNNKGLSAFLFFVICVLLCTFAAMRNGYDDTRAYIEGFQNVSRRFSYVLPDEKFQISNVYLFRLWNWLIFNYCTQNVHVYLGLCALVSVVPVVRLIKKYSTDFRLSMFIYMTIDMYIFSLAGVKQAMAVGIMAVGIEALISKKYFWYYVFCVIAMGFHTYAIVFLIIPLLGKRLWNKRMLFFCLFALSLSAFLPNFTDVIISIVEFLGKEVSEEMLLEGGVKIFRIFAYSSPLVLSLFAVKKIRSNPDIPQELFAKLGVLTSIFIILAYFGNPVLFGRLSAYTMIGECIGIPYLVTNVFSEKTVLQIKLFARICFTVYMVYFLYNRGAFERDVFFFFGRN